MSAPAEKDKYDKDVIASEQYQEKLNVYEAWFKSGHSPHYTMLSSMHDDLLEEFN